MTTSPRDEEDPDYSGPEAQARSQGSCFGDLGEHGPKDGRFDPYAEFIGPDQLVYEDFADYLAGRPVVCALNDTLRRAGSVVAQGHQLLDADGERTPFAEWASHRRATFSRHDDLHATAATFCNDEYAAPSERRIRVYSAHGQCAVYNPRRPARRDLDTAADPAAADEPEADEPTG